MSTSHARPIRSTLHAYLPGWVFNEYADGSFDAANAATGGYSPRFESRAEAVAFLMPATDDELAAHAALGDESRREEWHNEFLRQMGRI